MTGYQQPKRLGIGPYWMRYAASFGTTIVAIIVAAFSFFAGSYGLVALACCAIVASGLYLRVIEMQRCRDIGWDPMLPWYFFGAAFLLSFLTFFGGPLAVLTSILGIVVGLADFVGSIVIGCLPGKAYSAPEPGRPVAYASYGAPYEGNKSADTAEDAEARYEDAIARALADYKSVEKSDDHGMDRPATQPISAAPAPRVAGFGRKGISGHAV